MLGDFNSYAKEQATGIIENAGYETCMAGRMCAIRPSSTVKPAPLDYAFANDSLSSQVTGVTTWHIIADEADAPLDYNTDFFAIRRSPMPTVTLMSAFPTTIRSSLALDLNQNQTPSTYRLQILHARRISRPVLMRSIAPAISPPSSITSKRHRRIRSRCRRATTSSPASFFSAGSDASLKEV